MVDKALAQIFCSYEVSALQQARTPYLSLDPVAEVSLHPKVFVQSACVDGLCQVVSDWLSDYCDFVHGYLSCC